nr:MAG TPA_asm: hypothetical protein [Caudoviricetes sp.]
MLYKKNARTSLSRHSEKLKNHIKNMCSTNI